MMQKTKLARRVAGLNLWVTLAIVSFAALVVAGAAGSALAQHADAQESGPLMIEVTLDDYSFSPEPLRIPAGREVTLVIRNVGKYAHEFMAGRDAEGNDFAQDLFADLHVNIEKVETTEAGHGEHNEGAGHDADAGHAADHDADAGHDADHDADAGHDEHAEQSADAQEHAHDAEHAHGTMVEAQVGETYLMTFTLPEDRRGEWATGCFLMGHYDAGMHGVLIVE